jgi:hypothetical protein
MPNTEYANIVLQSQLDAVLETKLNSRTLMAVDTDLAEAAGMIKQINRYNYTGYVDQVTEGNGNTNTSLISHTPYSYTVKVYQQKFDVRDEEIMADPKVLDFGIAAASETMVNHLNDLFFSEIVKTVVDEDYASGISYDDIVDAIGKLNLEEEGSLYILGGNDMRTALRKDDAFVAARQGEIIFSGHIGFLAGIPVIISKKVETGIVYVADKNAVRLFLKKDSEVAQERDEDKRTTSYFFRRVGLVALMDGTKICRLGAANTDTPTVSATVAGATAVAGAVVAECDFIDVYVNGVKIASGTHDSTDTDAYSIAVPALVTGDKLKIYARPAGKVGKWSAEVTVTSAD